MKTSAVVAVTLLALLGAACTGQDEESTPSPTTSTMDQPSASPALAQGCPGGHARVYAETECLPTHGAAPVCIWTPHGDVAGCGLVAGAPATKPEADDPNWPAK